MEERYLQSEQLTMPDFRQQHHSQQLKLTYLQPRQELKTGLEFDWTSRPDQVNLELKLSMPWLQ